MNSDTMSSREDRNNLQYHIAKKNLRRVSWNDVRDIPCFIGISSIFSSSSPIKKIRVWNNWRSFIFSYSFGGSIEIIVVA